MAGYFSVDGSDYFFLHIPKTGGKMWEYLFSNLGLTSGHDVVKCKPYGFSFTVIRNPFDRLVSCFCYLKAGGCHAGDAEDAMRYGITTNSFSDWVKLASQNPEYYLEQQHVMPMMKRIGDKSYFDHIALFENLEQETKELHNMMYGHEIENVPVINKSNHTHFEEYYTEETKNIVSNLYADDIKLYEELTNAQNI
jgi:chondroitin 4-sulfotransferase 11